MKIGILLIPYIEPSGVPVGWEHKLVPASEAVGEVDRIGHHHHDHNEKLPYSNLYGDVMLTPLQEELFRSISNGSRNIASFSPGKSEIELQLLLQMKKHATQHSNQKSILGRPN